MTLPNSSIELVQDYAPRYVNGIKVKGRSPYARFYRDLKSNKGFMVVSGLPKIKALGRRIDAGWLYAKGKYYSKANLFSAIVSGGQVTITCLSDQPYGAKRDSQVIYQSQLFLNGIERLPVNTEPALLSVDPLNPNYQYNVLEWDYGICIRRVRIIEGSYQERWVFKTNPRGEVRIKHNQVGSFKLRFGQYQVNSDEELVPVLAFNEAEYPFEVGATATFYPDADPETSSVDGRIYVNAVATWAGARSATIDRKSTRLNSSHTDISRMPSSA